MAGRGPTLTPAGGTLRVSATVEVAAPSAHAFALARDFRGAERRARARGATVRRLEPGDGARIRWRVSAPWRGRMRRFTLSLLSERPGQRLEFGFAARPVAGTASLRFVATGPESSRLEAVITLRPCSLPARVALRALRLAGNRLDRRLARELERRAARIAEHWRAARDSRDPPG